MSRPDEGMIHAWLDGELTAEEGAELERRVASDPEWAAAVAEARGFIAASSRIVGALDAMPGRVIPGQSGPVPKQRRPARGFHVRPWMGLAAGLVLTVGTALVVWSPESLDEVAKVDTEADAAMPLGAVAQVPDSAVPAPPPRSAPAPAGAREVAPLREIVRPDTRIASGAGDAPPVPPVAQPPLLPLAPQTQVQTVASADVAGAPAERRQRMDDTEAQRLRASQESRAEVTANFATRDEPLRAMARPAAAGLSGKVGVVSSLLLSGCWRAAPPFTPDTILRDLMIVGHRGDSLVVVLSRTRQVTVVQRGDTLSGELSAIRTECPSDRSPDPE